MGVNVYYGEIDAPIRPVIEVLNKKGYITSASCCGHPYAGHIDDFAYIQFEFGSITPEELPRHWYWVKDDLMEYKYKAGSTRISEQHEMMKRLLKWAEDLPDATK